MAAFINAVSGGAGGIQSKGDASGALNIQTAGTTAIAIDASQNVTFTNAPTSATIKSAAVNTPTVFQDSAGTQVGTLCRAWVNFNGVTTATIRASFNVSSVTRNATGDYTINFATAFSDTNYVAVMPIMNSTSAAGINRVAGIATSDQVTPALYTTTQLNVTTGKASNATGFGDNPVVLVAVFR